MLELRHCYCENSQSPETTDAIISNDESAFYAHGAATRLGGVCTNLGGNFAARPISPAGRLADYSLSTVWMFNPSGCATLAA